MRFCRGICVTVVLAVALAIASGPATAGDPAEDVSHNYRSDNPFVEPQADPAASPSFPTPNPGPNLAFAPTGEERGFPPAQEDVGQLKGIGQLQPVNPFAIPSPVEQTAWQQAPPVPPAPSKAKSSESFLNAIAPWNPTPSNGVRITPPAKKYPAVKVIGLIQAESILIDQDDANKATIGDVPNGAGLRRARFGIKGDAWENVGFKMEMEFAGRGRPSFLDVYLNLRDLLWLPGTMRIGRWRQPFGMASSTSIREVSFIERPLIHTFAPFRQTGVGMIDPNKADNTTWAFSGFRYPSGPYGNNFGDSGGISFATRETIIFGGETKTAPLLHLGGDLSYLNSSFDRFRFRTTPEIAGAHTSGPLLPTGATLGIPTFADTGVINASQAGLFGAELAGRSGSFWFQGESYVVAVDQITASNPTFWGAYLQAGWILTGEVRPYSKAVGTFTRVLPQNPVASTGGMGAWEVAGRISTIDLTSANITGGRLTNAIAGLNWYLNPRTKVQFNYVHAFLNRPPGGQSNANVLAARAQIDF